MAAKLQHDWDRHYSTFSTWIGSDVHHVDFLATIRDLLSVLQTTVRLGVPLSVDEQLISTVESLLSHPQLLTEIRPLVGKILCLVKLHITRQATLQDLMMEIKQGLINGSTGEEAFQHVCRLFGVIDCLPAAGAEAERSTEAVGQLVAALLNDYDARYYYKLKLVHAWLLHVHDTQPTLDSPLLRLDGVILGSSNLHWEDACAGSAELAEQILTLLCRIWAAPSSPRHGQNQAQILADRALADLTWQSKTKYLILTTLAPYFDIGAMLRDHPDTVMAMAGSLGSNYLLSAGASLFKALAKSLDAETWRCYCGTVLWDALHSPKAVVRKNAVEKWLPSIGHAKAPAFDDLKERLLTADQGFNWLAYVALLKQAPDRPMDDADLDVVARALQHGDELVSALAFASLCYARKKTQPIEQRKWDLISDFIVENLHSDSPQFRQNMQAHAKIFLLRVLENSLSYVKSKPSDKSSTIGRAELHVDLKRNMDGVQTLHDRLTRHLGRDAGYQRKIAALGVLHLLLKLFGSADSQVGNITKSSCVDKRGVLIELARSHQLWNFGTDESLRRLTICVTDQVAEVQDKAAEILCEMFQPSGASVGALLERGLRLCDSHKFQRSEAGAKLLHLAAFWGGTQPEKPVDQPDLAASHFGSLEAACAFVRDAVERRLAALRRDFLDAATRTPMHGFVFALRHLLRQFADRPLASYRPIIHLCRDISDFMLSILSRKARNGTDTAPSFEEMGESIADVVRQHLPADRVEQVSISVHHQLVLSCAWLNIKESAHLASQVGLCLLRHEEALPLEERAAQIDECVRLIGRTLLCCRHKGAIEGAGEALAALCRRLLARAEPPLRAVPGRLLSSLLDRFEQPFVGVSITRRSAGMALLVGKIVASEPAKSERPLVAMATKRLMAVAERPIDESQLDETCDLPQSVAIHMLQVLVHDASLVAAMQPHLASLVRLGVGSLDRGPWPVRNAALQLYGALVPKLTGNTRNRDTPCGAPTTRELFHKLPGLADFLLDQLDQQRRSAGLLGGGLIAVLSLLCRLSPGRDHACNQRFTPHLTALLAHPAAQVRVLASQTLLAFVPLHRTKETTLLLCADALTLAADADAELRVCSVRHSTNGLHGCLAAVAEFLHRCRSVALSVEDWQTIRESVSSLEVIERRHRCHYVKLAVLKLFDAVGVSPAHAPAGADAVQRFLDEASAHRDAGLDAATPGYVPWLRLKTELLLNHSPLDCLLSAVDGVLRLENGPDIVESGLAALTKRVAKLSHSSVLSNSVALKVGACLHGWRHMPSLLAVSLECVLQRGAGALLVTDTSLVFFVDFFLERCIDGRQFGTSTALLALPTAAVVLRDAARKALLPDNVVGPFLLRLSESLLTASRASEAVAYRKACADSLRLAGRIWLEMADKDVQFSRNLFQVVLNLIQDEDRDVRSEATLFLSALLAETPPAAANAGVVDVLSGRCCLRRFAADIGRWFRPLDLLPLIFQLLTSDAVEPDNRPLYADPACSEHFYEPESANFYREEGETADFLVAVAASLAAGAAPTEPLGRHVDVDAALLVDEADRLRRRLDAAAESDAGFGFAESTPLHSALVQWSAKLRVAALCFPPHADRFETLRLQLHQRFVAF